MINKPLEQIERTDIESLIANEVREGRTLEYKEKLLTNNDGEKKEFLADVSSFANAGGGDILFGVREKRDAAGKTTGIPESAPGLQLHNLDETILRLENIIRDGVAPRLIAHIQPVAGFFNGPVIVIRISQSWNSPHMIVYQDWSRFYSRTSAGKYVLDVAELRTAFEQAGTFAEKAERFWNARALRIVTGQTPVPLLNNPKLILHLLPVASFGSSLQIDLTQVNQHESDLYTPIGNEHSFSRRYNFDGYLSYGEPTSEGFESYLQLFRSGILEAVDAYLLRPRPVIQPGTERFIPLTRTETVLLNAVERGLRLYKSFEIAPPIGVKVAMMGVKGYRVIDPDKRVYAHTEEVLEHENLLFPDVLIQDFSENPSHLLRPLFDALWQSGGHRRSQNYDASGNRLER